MRYFHDRAFHAKLLASVVLGAATVPGVGCGPAILAYDADSLRAEMLRRAPELPPTAVVVPFELDEKSIEIAGRAAGAYTDPEGQVRALVETLFSGAGYALRYAPVVTTSARETIATRRGNCLALASVFVGAARALGLKAYYLDASQRVHGTSELGSGVFVNTGHITAYADLGKTRWYLDFDKSLAGVPHDFRVIDDVEATAHFYNNRGYERIEQALVDDAPADWAAAAQDFTLATRIVPRFARAWNNLGVARARLGQLARAEEAYRQAIRAAPWSSAAYNNLGGLYLQAGRAQDALEVIRDAVRLDPHGAYSQFNMGRALLATGDREGGRAALELAAKLRDGNAERMLSKLELYRGKRPPAKPR